jgi:parvulin-like peptidyl-prolyl isomerase
MSAILAVPLFSDKLQDVPVATAGDEVVTLGQLAAALETSHAKRKEGEPGARMEFAPMLERLLNARLILTEARAMGIGELPQVKTATEDFERVTFREALQRRATEGTAPDAMEVEKAYRNATREWKVTSVLFKEEASASAFVAALKAGGDFLALAKQAEADGKAKVDPAKDFVRGDALLPAVYAEISPRKPGEVTGLVKLKDGVAVARLDEQRQGEDPALRATFEAQSIERQNKEKLKAFYADMVKRLVKIDKATLRSVDFTRPKAVIEKWKTDKRPLARIQGAAPVTVGELVHAQLTQFFHGVDPKKGVKANAMNEQTLDALVSERIVPVEARRLGLHETPEYRRRLAAQIDGVVFNLFVQRAIVPEIQITDEQVRAHYDGNKKAFTYPVFYRLEGLAFGAVKDAQAAFDKLRGGTDVKWLKQNAAGQLDPEKAALHLDNSVLSEKALPEDLRARLQGAKPGDARLFTDEGQAYVVRVADVTPEQQRPFEEAQGEIRQKLFFDAVTKGIEDWAAKIKKVRPVHVYLQKISG